jgi:hypothetical protein
MRCSVRRLSARSLQPERVARRLRAAADRGRCRTMPRRRLASSPVAVAACSPLRGCVESEFTLANDSRMPIWFQSETNADRPNFGVKLTYWTYGRNAEFALVHRRGVTLRKVYGESCWHPSTRPRTNAKGSLSWAGVSKYTIVKVGGLVDVIDHTGPRSFADR